MERPILATIIFVLALAASAGAAQTGTRPLTVDALLQLKRVADPQLSPDGRWVAYTVSRVDRPANRTRTQIYLVLAGGGEPRQLTSGDASAWTPRWSPDGRRLAFTLGGQIWMMEPDGSNQRQITDLSTGATDPIWSPDGRLIAFVSDVYPGCADDACNRRRDEEAEVSRVRARAAESLLYRQWAFWKGGKRTHVFVVSSEGGVARDLTPGDFDAPPFSVGDPTDYAFSPDSKELAFSRNTDKLEAASTNADIFVVSVSGGEPRRLTGDNRGADRTPRYSPDGRFIAYRSQATPTFESDRWRLMLYDRQANRTRELLPKFDGSVDGFTFAPDGSSIYFISGERAREPVFEAALADGSVRKLLEGFIGDFQVSLDSRLSVFTRSTAARPTEIYTARLDRLAPVQGGDAVTQLTRTNDDFLSQFALVRAEELTWEGAGGVQMQGWIFKPPNFDASKKYPLIVLIHGGPQGTWNDAWSYRWNPQVFASRGYVVFQPNPRGSTGFGQQFTKEISGDWGGKAYTDIMNGVAQVVAMPFVDRENVGAAGASYGGYMVNWILGHNDHPAVRFKALVSHAGVFNLESMYGATDALWFVEWEFKGTPWDAPELYAKWSPHRYVKNFKTPTLVTHGELDFRMPVSEALQLFTALQRQGVDSKLVVFPDEGHWILRPQNSAFWYSAVLDWFDLYLKRGTKRQPS